MMDQEKSMDDLAELLREVISKGLKGDKGHEMARQMVQDTMLSLTRRVEEGARILSTLDAVGEQPLPEGLRYDIEVYGGLRRREK